MIKVFLVDDHPIIRTGLKRILSPESDIQVVGEAGSLEETRDLLRSQAVDVIILDLSMPGISGFEALQEIRTSQPESKILILSIHPEDQYALRALKAGASGYLSKECAPEQLVDAIRTLVHGDVYLGNQVREKWSSHLGKGEPKEAHEALSEREFQVFLAIGKGRPLREIAKAMTLSEKTVSTYRERVLRKMKMASNSEIIQYAYRHNLIT